MQFLSRGNGHADVTATNVPARKRQRWGCRFTLSTLLLVTFLVAVVIARVGNDAIRQRNTVEQLQQYRLTVSYDYEYESGFRHHRAVPPEPGWIIDAVGIDYFHNVVDIHGFITEQSALPLIANLEHLEGDLRLAGDLIEIQDSDLRHVRHLDQLTGLRLSDNPISDDGLRRLVHLSKLTKLSLDGTLITDDGCTVLPAFPRLESLALSDTRITAAAIPHLLKLKELRTLALNGAPIGDDDVKKLTTLSRLESLGVGDSRITDRALEHIVNLQGLRILNLSDTEVTDAGIEVLLDLPHLQHLWCYGTRVTASGAERFRTRRPECSLYVEDE